MPPRSSGILPHLHTSALSAPQPLRLPLKICAYNLCGPSAPHPIVCAHVDLIPSTFRLSPLHPPNPLDKWWASQFQSCPGLCRQSADSCDELSHCEHPCRNQHTQSHRSGVLLRGRRPIRCRQDPAQSQGRHRNPGRPTDCREPSRQSGQDRLHCRGTGSRQSLIRFNIIIHAIARSSSHASTRSSLLHQSDHEKQRRDRHRGVPLAGYAGLTSTARQSPCHSMCAEGLIDRIIL